MKEHRTIMKRISECNTSADLRLRDLIFHVDLAGDWLGGPIHRMVDNLNHSDKR